MAKNLTVRLDDELAAVTEALARAEGRSLNETIKRALNEAVERRREDPDFRARVRRVIEADRSVLERLGGAFEPPMGSGPPATEVGDG